MEIELASDKHVKITQPYTPDSLRICARIEFVELKRTDVICIGITEIRDWKAKNPTKPFRDFVIEKMGELWTDIESLEQIKKSMDVT